MKVEKLGVKHTCLQARRSCKLSCARIFVIISTDNDCRLVIVSSQDVGVGCVLELDVDAVSRVGPSELHQEVRVCSVER